MNKNFWLATATLAGSIIGGGIFALPYVVNKSGFLPFGVYLLVLTGIQFLLHIIFAEIVLSTGENHRIPGYARIYAGKKTKFFTLILSLIGRHGAILAYILLGGSFLYALLNPVFGFDMFFYATVLFFVEMVIIFFGLKAISRVELILSLLLIGLMMLLSIKSYGVLDISNNLQVMDLKYALLPYGPVFFAVAGQTAIPEVCRLLKHNKSKIKSSIFWGTITPAILTLIFAFVVVGVTGAQTTQDALTGLKSFLSDGIINFALIFGLLCVITSFLVNSQALREVYWWDLKVNKYIAWLLAGFIPFGLYVLGVSNITKTISLTGSITGGLIGIVLIVLLFKVKQSKHESPYLKLKIKKVWAVILSLFFLASLIYEIYYSVVL